MGRPVTDPLQLVAVDSHFANPIRRSTTTSQVNTGQRPLMDETIEGYANPIASYGVPSAFSLWAAPSSFGLEGVLRTPKLTKQSQFPATPTQPRYSSEKSGVFGRKSNVNYFRFCVRRAYRWRAYLPISSPWAKMCPFIAASTSFLTAVAGSVSIVSSAYTFKKYRCVPPGGQGPP